jgi:hypothetical protein
VYLFLNLFPHPGVSENTPEEKENELVENEIEGDGKEKLEYKLSPGKGELFCGYLYGGTKKTL